MAQGRMDFEFHFSTAPAARRRRSDDQPMRILALADLSARAAGERVPDLAHRRPLALDVDNLNRVFARLAPRLALDLEGPWGQRLALDFGSLEDFHPDNLFRRSPAFGDHRELRGELLNPSAFARAAAAVAAHPPAAAPESDADAIERLLGRAPAPGPAPSAAVAVVQRFVRGIVAPHVLPDTAQAQRQALAALDAASGSRMGRILHHPRFQSLEAAWRGAAKLATELELGESLQLHVLDVARDELEADLRQAVGDLSRCALYAVLCGPDTEGPEGAPWSLIVCDLSFGPGADDIALLAALGALGAAAGAPLLAGAKPAVLGCADAAALAQPRSWQPLAADAAARWQALRRSAAAPWIGLALPRVLGRLPYGRRADPIEAFEFEEPAQGGEHDAFLWTNPAWPLAVLAAQGFAEEGWSLDLDRHFELTDLPSYTFRDEDGEPRQQPCAEVLMSEAAAEAVLAQGPMPLVSYRGRNAARMLRWQSLAQPPRPWAGLGVTGR